MARTGGLTESQEVVVAAVAAVIPSGPVVVALSGGADSAALAWALTCLGVEARAVSIDHGLPGSSRLMSAASAIAAALNMEHAVIPVASESTSETSLRAARLAALEDAAGDRIVLTAHTADDQAETVLGNLVRGAGATGLSGIPTRRGHLLRPLLAVPREVVRRAAAEAGLPFVDDPENTDPTIWRNRIRSVTIPHLAEEYNPAVRAALARAASLVGADDALIADRAAGVPIVRDEEAVLIPAAALTTLPFPVATRVVRRALRLFFDPYPGTFDEVETVLRTAATAATASLSGGVMVSRERAFVVLHPAEATAPDPVDLIPGDVAHFGPWTIGPADPGPALGPWRVAISLGSRTLIRAPEPGDRIAIGGGGHKTVSDALGEARVPVRLRSRWPLVVSDDTIAWIVGVRVAAGHAGRGTTLSARRASGREEPA